MEINNKWNYDIENMTKSEMRKLLNELGDELAAEYSTGAYGSADIDKINDFSERIEFLKGELNKIVLEKYRNTAEDELEKRKHEIEEKLNPDYYDSDIEDALGVDLVDNLNNELSEINKELEERQQRKENSRIEITFSSNKSNKVKYSVTNEIKTTRMESFKKEAYTRKKFDNLKARFEADGAEAEYEEIFGKIADKSKIKYCDPEVVYALYKEKGKDTVLQYLNLFEKGKQEGEFLPFKIKYDLSEIWKDKELSIAEKIHLNRIARESKDFAEVINEKNNALSIFGAMLGIEPKKKVKMLNEGKEEEKTDNTEKKDRKENNQEPELNEEKKSDFKQDLVNKAKETKPERNIHTKVELGETMKLPEGLELKEGFNGSVSGRIGDKNNDKNGIYVVDYSAEMSDTDVHFEYGLEGNSTPKTIGSKQMIHVSFVEGAKTEEEARKMIAEYKEKAKDDMDVYNTIAKKTNSPQKEKIDVIDYSKVRPAGWITAEQYKEIVKDRAKEKEEKTNDDEKER